MSYGCASFAYLYGHVADDADCFHPVVASVDYHLLAWVLGVQVAALVAFFLLARSAERDLELAREREIQALVGLAQPWTSHMGEAGSECALCLEEFVPEGPLVLKLHCGHHFHSACVERWMHATPNQTRTCPVCRQNCLAHDLDRSEEDCSCGRPGERLLARLRSAAALVGAGEEGEAALV